MANIQKLQELAENEGLSIDELLDLAAHEGMAPGICINPGCNFTITTMELGGPNEFCEHCNTDTVKSAVQLVGIR